MDSPDPRQAGREASRAVLGRGSLYTLGTAAPILAQVAVTPAVTRLLGPTQGWGQVAAALVVLQVTMMLASLGMPSVITRQALLGVDGVPGARSLLLRGSAIAVALTSIAALFLRALPASATTGGLAATAVLAGGLLVVVENAQAMLRALDRPATFVLLSTLASLCGPLLGLALIARPGSRSPSGYLLGLLIGYGVAAAVSLAVTAGGPRSRRQGDLADALRLGLPVLPHLAALYLASGGLVLLAGAAFGDRDAGRLQLAFLVGASPAVVIGALNNAWAPAVYSAEPRHRGAVIQRTARDVMVVASLICGSVALLSPWLLRLLADDRFDLPPLVPMTAVFTVGSLASVAYLANVHLIFAQGRSLGLAAVTPLSLIAGMATAVVGSRVGLAPIAVGYAVMYVALAVGTGWLRRHVGGASWRESRLVGPSLVGLALIGTGAALPTSGAGALARWTLALAAGAALVAIVLRHAARA